VFCAQDPSFIVQGQVAFSYGNVLTTKEYAYGQGAPGPLLRTTTNKYLVDTNDNPATAAKYSALNIASNVIRQTIADGSGSVASDTLA
jgi:hypothetical protein